MNDLIDPRELADVPEEPVDPATRSDTENWDYARLLRTGRDVANIGRGRLVLSYAGRNPDRIKITCRNGKAAKRTQMLLRRDLRKVGSDAAYNAAIEAFLQAIRDAQAAKGAGAGGENE